MYHFHANVFAHPFRCTWDEAAAALDSLPRMILEPDGSWIWSGGEAHRRWQIDGHLYDFEDRLHRVELHGTCPPEMFDKLLRCIGWPVTQLSFELVREGRQLGESGFREAVSRS